MKFVKGISLLFIYPVTMYGLGFASNMVIHEYFYPGEKQANVIENRQLESSDNDVVEAGLLDNPVITADTSYVILSYDMVSGSLEETEETAPDKYIGLNRERLEKELKEYGESPSLTDLEKGFMNIELLSFSPDRVVVRKSFQKEEETEGFFLINENNVVVVYDKSLTHVYMDTGIRTDELPWVVQNEIMNMKYMESESELYHFLESYSS